MRTLSQILIDANAYLDLDASLPTNTELTTRTNYADQAVQKAAATSQLPELHTIYEIDPASTSRVTLPANFKELMGVVHQNIGSGQYDEFPEIEPMDRFSKESTDKYCYIIGNPASRYTAVFNNLTANATLSFDYQRFPSGLVTLTDVCELSDPMYVVEDIESFVLESRSDDRFPTVKASANARLQNMIGRGSRKSQGGTNTIKKIGIAAYELS